MFKIPTYEELEKKESLRNQDTKDYTSRIFQKRKKDQNSPETPSPKELDPNSVQSPSTIEIESPSKTLNTEQQATTSKATNDPPEMKTTEQTAANYTEADEDDDDELLNNFIIENKDIIESGSQVTSSSSSSSIKSQKPSEFVVPSVPAPIKFDPKIPIQRAPQILQSNSTRYKPPSLQPYKNPTYHLKNCTFV